MDGTPIYDIKPYVVYADCHPDARSGFVDERKWDRLEVLVSDEVKDKLNKQGLTDAKISILKEVFAKILVRIIKKILTRFMECPTRVWIFTSGFPIKP